MREAIQMKSQVVAEIVEKLKGAHNKLGMNMRLLIQSIIDKHNYEKT